MKIYISADIEGITGTTSWSETEKSLPNDYDIFADQMTNEVKAACDGAIKAGAADIFVKDAHDTGRNIKHDKLPEIAKLMRGWSGHPFSMVSGLDESFDAAIFIGYHSGGYTGGNPLAHTMNNSDVSYIKMNGEYTSEFLIHAYAAATVGVPVVFVSGDADLSREIKKVNSNIETLAVKECSGGASISIHPDKAISMTEKLVTNALSKDLSKCLLKLPEEFEIEIAYRDPAKASRLSYYPGVKQLSGNILYYKTENYFEVLRMFNFLT
ncbi:M55 family metallopeptidase [Clostridium oryzae]|uniref:D-aminopeptidase n=1 Tax=Clostridium oryzae TaxID=1450648 RepID=A0A1V4ITB8_9CLOT|nr:M55 family metallopeptidase [Clostridium oryzae]OPJ63060.1 D-aminopeptidase [Clostridium oryzae]